MQISKRTGQWRSATHARFLQPPALLVASVSMSALVLTPAAVLAAVLGIWRFGADAGWTSGFFITNGLLSRYQLWFAVAIGSEACAVLLSRWVANQNLNLPQLAP